MSLTVLNFGGCCTAKIITGFGQTYTAQYGGSGTMSEEQIKRQVDALIRGPRIGRRNGLAVITITSDQTQADKVLTKMGFIGSEWMDKEGHAGSKLKLFYINPKKYLDANPKAPVVPKSSRAGLVKNLRPEMLRRYNRNRELARNAWDPVQQGQWLAAAENIMQNPENFIQTTP